RSPPRLRYTRPFRPRCARFAPCWVLGRGCLVYQALPRSLSLGRTSASSDTCFAFVYVRMAMIFGVARGRLPQDRDRRGKQKAIPRNSLKLHGTVARVVTTCDFRVAIHDMKLASRITLAIGTCGVLLFGVSGWFELRQEAHDLEEVARAETLLLGRS